MMTRHLNVFAISIEMLMVCHITADNVKWRKMAVYLGARWDDVDDVIQIMYLKLLEIEEREGNINRMVMHNGKVNPLYIFKILQSAVIDQYRDEQKQVVIEYIEHPIEPPDEMEHRHAELMDEIKAIIDTFHEYEQMMLELYFVYGYSMREIEKRTGIPTHSIFNTIKNCKQKIKEKTQSKYDEYIQSKIDTEQIEGVGRHHRKNHEGHGY
jgi:RNA polymerase sigma factor (sigma-70 family)